MVDISSTRRSVLQGIGAVGSTGLLLSSIGSAAGSSGEDVSKREARRIARKAVERIGAREEFSSWRRQGVRAPELFYAKVQGDESIEYEPRAWVFPVENRGDDSGYIAIDAGQKESPVLAYGDNTAPQRRLDTARRVAKANGSSIHKRFLYHGGVEFGVETADGKLAGLRAPYIKSLNPVADIAKLRPTHEDDDTKSQAKKPGDEEDWSGSPDDQVYGVPNWTDTDYGGESITYYGTGPDSWDGWDGCVPIAASMVVGYHEGISDSENEKREKLIDYLHVKMNTSNDGVTSWSDCPTGIENLPSIYDSYSANNRSWGMKGRVKTQISNDNPVILNMRNSPFTAGEDAGHSVCGVGYREESCGWFCSDFYHKVYNGWHDDNPDMVSHGNWGKATVTKVTT